MQENVTVVEVDEDLYEDDVEIFEILRAIFA